MIHRWCTRGTFHLTGQFNHLYVLTLQRTHAEQETAGCHAGHLMSDRKLKTSYVRHRSRRRENTRGRKLQTRPHRNLSGFAHKVSSANTTVFFDTYKWIKLELYVHSQIQTTEFRHSLRSNYIRIPLMPPRRSCDRPWAKRTQNLSMDCNDIFRRCWWWAEGEMIQFWWSSGFRRGLDHWWSKDHRPRSKVYRNAS